MLANFRPLSLPNDWTLRVPLSSPPTPPCQTSFCDWAQQARPLAPGVPPAPFGRRRCGRHGAGVAAGGRRVARLGPVPDTPSLVVCTRFGVKGTCLSTQHVSFLDTEFWDCIVVSRSCNRSEDNGVFYQLKNIGSHFWGEFSF